MYRCRYIELEGMAMREGRERKCLIAILAATAVAMALVTPADAIRILAGNLVLDVGGGFAPRALPSDRDAPIVAWGHEKLWTEDGSVPPPLEHLRFEFDRHGHVETRGLAVCLRRKVLATTAKQARRACPGAIVGTGLAEVVVAFSEQAPIVTRTKTTFFNAPPIHGDPAIIVHAFLDVPSPLAYVDTFRIEEIDKGVFGYRVEADTARIAGGYGSVVFFNFKLGRSWTYRGRRLSYINARCAPGHHALLVRAFSEYADGTVLNGSFVGRCQPRRD
jgi:hypothetical protein